MLESERRHKDKSGQNECGDEKMRREAAPRTVIDSCRDKKHHEPNADPECQMIERDGRNICGTASERAEYGRGENDKSPSDQERDKYRERFINTRFSSGHTIQFDASAMMTPMNA